MKYCLLTLLAGSLAIAQATLTTSTTDINGRTTGTTSVLSPTGRTELSVSVNGRQVPLEQTEEKVLREDANGKVTEKITRRYDPNGQLAATERVVTTAEKLGDGGSSVHATTYRSDGNGHMQEAERKTIETHQQGTVTRSETVTARPSLSGSFQATEKQSTVTDVSGGTTHEEQTVYRRSENGDYYQALRQVKDEHKNGDQTVTQTNAYEPGVTGSLQLARQEVSTTTKRADGSEVTEVNLYAHAVDGRVQDSGAPLQIKEQQIISRDKGAGGQVIETVSVRRPSVSDPTHLGSSQKISQTVCKGKCSPDDKP